MDVVQVRFAFVALCELSYLIPKLFSKLFHKRIILAPFVFKIKMWLVLRTSFGVLFRILLRTPDGILKFMGCCHTAVIGSGIFQFSQAQVYVFLLEAFV